MNEFALSAILAQLENSDQSIKVSADLGNMKQMLCVIRSILATKPTTGLTSRELQALAVLLLRVRMKFNARIAREQIALNFKAFSIL